MLTVARPPCLESLLKPLCQALVSLSVKGENYNTHPSSLRGLLEDSKELSLQIREPVCRCSLCLKSPRQLQNGCVSLLTPKGTYKCVAL